MSLYLYQNNQQTGPFTEEQIGQMIQSGQVTRDTMGWKQGMASWQPIASLVPAVNGGVPPAPPIPLVAPPAEPAQRSALGMISFVISLVALVGWFVLLIAAGVAHNEGTATKTFNMIVGFLFIGGVVVNFVAMVLGVIGIFKGKSNTFAILGACLNGFQIVGLIALLILGLAAGHGGE